MGVLRFEARGRFAVTPEQLWPYVSDTHPHEPRDGASSDALPRRAARNRRISHHRRAPTQLNRAWLHRPAAAAGREARRRPGPAAVAARLADRALDRAPVRVRGAEAVHGAPRVLLGAAGAVPVPCRPAAGRADADRGRRHRGGRIGRGRAPQPPGRPPGEVGRRTAELPGRDRPVPKLRALPARPGGAPMARPAGVRPALTDAIATSEH